MLPARGPREPPLLSIPSPSRLRMSELRPTCSALPVCAVHPSTCMRSEPVNGGPWTYERGRGRYLRIQAARSGGAPRGMAVVFPSGKRGCF
ncbi:unnamed protein product [Penicillium roqueforti FM164]|uniref:Genomic scaffold, ProqFM164S02 n=1 Tax=Penicillium roqueforti (strain FM164) TaxID=1365484 RepID=W6Q8J1_PENRF|nr:unnamed protein product [Penicillium roqueforti FM164]